MLAVIRTGMEEHGISNIEVVESRWPMDAAPRGDVSLIAHVSYDIADIGPFLDAMETTIIRDSRWRCDHGWDIDLDDGSSNYEIYNNLMLAGGLKLREGYGRKASNNIHINNGLHPHVWFRDSGDEFTRNIVMAAHAPIGQPDGLTKNHRYCRGK